MGQGEREAIRRVSRVVLASGLAIAGWLSLLTPPAHAVEAIQDGRFDATDCGVPQVCTNPNWTRFLSHSATPSGFGPLCGPLGTECASSGSGYNSSPNWVRLAGAVTGSNGTYYVTSHIRQSVVVPVEKPTLRFVVRTPTGVDFTYLTVQLDGATVFITADAYPDYTEVVVDLNAYAGSTRLLEFEATDTFFAGYSNTYDIDDVSLTDHPTATAPATAPPGATVTGQRAAALIKCKAKKSKKARKKCRKKANALPA